MTNFLVSSFSMTAAPRSSVFRAQQDLAIAQKEVVTGRHADVGLTLGVSVSRTIAMRAELSNAEKLTSANDAISQRFQTMQTVLGNVATTAENLLSSLVSNGTSDIGLRTAGQQAVSGIGQMVGALNSSLGSRFLFSGAATDRPAMKTDLTDDYATSDAAQAGAAAWQTFLDANAGGDAANVSAADLETFLSDGGAFDALFHQDGANDVWKDTWSDASDVAVVNRIDQTEMMTTSVSANEDAFRNIAKAYVMLSALQSGELNEASKQVLTSRAIETLGKGLTQLTDVRTVIGGHQERIERTREALDSRSMVLEVAIAKTEEVDVYEASTRVTNLMNVLETSYALTSRLSRLSLLNYL